MLLRQRFPQLKFFLTLRVRLAGIFLLLLAVVLAVVGGVGLETQKTVIENQGNQILADELGALKGYIHIEGGIPNWEVDKSDPEENAAYAQLDDVFVLANDRGDVDALSSIDPSLSQLGNRKTILNEMSQLAKNPDPVVKEVISTDHVHYRIISGTLKDTKTGNRWYVAEGRSLAADNALIRKFRRNFLIFLPIALVACAIVSWYSAGRALRALQAVDSAAQQVTGSNLGLQIPRRGADDELDRLIDSFNQMSSRLKAAFDQTRQFSTDVSHELRTPLTAIQGQLEVALLTGQTKAQLQEAIENALTDVERLANLVRALLLLSQSELGQMPTHKSVLDLGELMEELVEGFQIPAEASNVTLTHTTKEKVMCAVDRTQIERVITNLFSNAIKYTPPGGWVKACAETAGSSVRLIVEDSGVGIPPDHVPHIFDRFYRVPDPNPEKGLGLGLSFVATIVKAHGGSIQVESKVGEGSRFEVLLPAGVTHGVQEAVLQS